MANMNTNPEIGVRVECSNSACGSERAPALMQGLVEAVSAFILSTRSQQMSCVRPHGLQEFLSRDRLDPSVQDRESSSIRLRLHIC